jgi:hypothetical protein
MKENWQNLLKLSAEIKKIFGKDFEYRNQKEALDKVSQLDKEIVLLQKKFKEVSDKLENINIEKEIDSLSSFFNETLDKYYFVSEKLKDFCEDLKKIEMNLEEKDKNFFNEQYALIDENLEDIFKDIFEKDFFDLNPLKKDYKLLLEQGVKELKEILSEVLNYLNKAEELLNQVKKFLQHLRKPTLFLKFYYSIHIGHISNCLEWAKQDLNTIESFLLKQNFILNSRKGRIENFNLLLENFNRQIDNLIADLNKKYKN